jgi:hypothetical protein
MPTPCNAVVLGHTLTQFHLASLGARVPQRPLRQGQFLK